LPANGIEFFNGKDCRSHSVAGALPTPALAGLMMSALIHGLVTITGITCLLIAAAYSLVTLAAKLIWLIRSAEMAPQTNPTPPITILKPLCGMEPGLHQHLSTFCRQDYPLYQVVFGVRDAADPALLIVDKLIKEFPELVISVVVNSRLHGDNYKVSNLVNMMDVVQHDLLVIADSDAIVGPDYLRRVTAPLLNPKVGLVTSIYRAVPTPTLWSRLGAMYVNEWFIPSVLLAWLFGHENYASGQTLCLRRDTLEAIGGLRPIADHLADDYLLGEMIRGIGQRIVLSKYEVEAIHHEPSFRSLACHQLRWMRTLKILRPRSFRFIFLSFSLPLALAGVFLVSHAGAGPAGTFAWAALGITGCAQLLLHLSYRIGSGRALLSELALIPLRDVLLCWIWVRTFFAPRVQWRGIDFNVDAQGVMRRSG
jgi:ceramide glucosyltransferase